MPAGLQPDLQLDSTNRTLQVLLATYNGERFLREQVNSILAQTLARVTILARDDGSTDSTPQILTEYARRYPARVQLLPSSAPTGHARDNYRALLQAANAPYVAFADQDDVWLPNKLELEMNAMSLLEERHGSSRPLLVFSDLRVVDQHLSPIAQSFWEHRRINPRNIHRIGRLLMENVLTGCTALLNAPLVNLARLMPQTAAMHDWWVALLASLFGHASYLDEQLVLYRQHESNVVGASASAPPLEIRRRLQHERCRERWRTSVLQAQELLRIHGSALSAPAKRELEELIRCDASRNPVYRLATMLRRGYFIEKPQANLATAWYLLARNG
jgi:glycosyltransferase involved in cell wall biosynthesis